MMGLIDLMATRFPHNGGFSPVAHLTSSGRRTSRSEGNRTGQRRRMSRLLAR